MGQFDDLPKETGNFVRARMNREDIRAEDPVADEAATLERWKKAEARHPAAVAILRDADILLQTLTNQDSSVITMLENIMVNA